MADTGALAYAAANVLDSEVLTEAGRRRAFAVISHRFERDHPGILLEPLIAG